MLKKDFLIQLIGSLSPNEKRYFKLYSNVQDSDSRFMKLFDLLENETTYNTKKLCTALQLTPQQLTGDKHYLQQMLLRCLRSFEESASDHSAAYIVHINRADVQLLANRRLLDQAVELADKTIAKGLEWEMFETVSQLLYIKWTSLYNLERLDELPPVLKEYDRVLAVMSELNAMNTLRSEISLAERKRSDKQIFVNILSHPLMKKKPENLLSLKAQIAWFEIRIKSYMAGGYPPDKALEIARMQFKHYEKKPDIKRQNPYTFLLGYDFLANTEMLAGNPLKALKVLDQEEAELDTLDLSKTTIKQWREHVLAVRTGALYRARLHRETIAEAEKVIPFCHPGRCTSSYISCFITRWRCCILHKATKPLINSNSLYNSTPNTGWICKSISGRRSYWRSSISAITRWFPTWLNRPAPG